MRLYKSSKDFKYFLFEDRKLRNLSIFTLEVTYDEENKKQYEFRLEKKLNMLQDGVEEFLKVLDIKIEDDNIN